MMNKIRKRFINLWTSYLVYYFGKVNLSIVVPALLVTYKNMTLYQVGLVASGFFFAYAIGQFLHGQISERFNPWVYISLGLILSGVMNTLLGFTAGYFVLLLVMESFDGFFQAMGWSSIVRANSLIQKKEKRETSTTILGCSYQVGNSVAWLISALVVGAWGWQAGFWVAAGFLAIRGITLWLSKPDIEIPKAQKVRTQIKKTLTTPIVLSGISLCLLNMVRYGIISWIPLYFFQQGKLSVEQMGKVGLKVFLIPIAGVLGTLVYNLFKKIDKDVLSVFATALIGVSFVWLAFVSGFWALVAILVGSFFLYGPHVFLVTTCPSRFRDDKVVAASTGFIDGAGYVGTTLVGIIVPFILTQTHNSWVTVFAFWAVLSFITSGIVAVNYFKYFRGRGRLGPSSSAIEQKMVEVDIEIISRAKFMRK